MFYTKKPLFSAFSFFLFFFNLKTESSSAKSYSIAASMLIPLAVAIVYTCRSFFFLVFFGGFSEQLGKQPLLSYLPPLRKLTGNGNLLKFETDSKRYLLENGRMDELEFGDEI